jgi:hypothetical protein
MTAKPVKPCRAYAIVDAKGQIVYVSDLHPLAHMVVTGERIIRGRFVPDAKKGRVKR